MTDLKAPDCSVGTSLSRGSGNKVPHSLARSCPRHLAPPLTSAFLPGCGGVRVSRYQVNLTTGRYQGGAFQKIIAQQGVDECALPCGKLTDNSDVEQRIGDASLELFDGSHDIPRQSGR